MSHKSINWSYEACDPMPNETKQKPKQTTTTASTTKKSRDSSSNTHSKQLVKRQIGRCNMRANVMDVELAILAHHSHITLLLITSLKMSAMECWITSHIAIFLLYGARVRCKRWPRALWKCAILCCFPSVQCLCRDRFSCGRAVAELSEWC